MQEAYQRKKMTIDEQMQYEEARSAQFL